MALEYLLTKNQQGVSKAPPLYHGQDLTVLLELIASEFRRSAGRKNPPGRAILVIDGPSASGKSFLAEALALRLDCPLVSMDHFFLPTELRTPARFKERGGNIHYERFRDEILAPARASTAAFSYRPWDCSQMCYGEPLQVEESPYLVIEGVYSLHPSFEDPWALSLMMSVDRSLQRQRIEGRETPEKAQRYFNEWLPLEASYFNDPQLHDRVDLRLQTRQIQTP